MRFIPKLVLIDRQNCMERKEIPYFHEDDGSPTIVRYSEEIEISFRHNCGTISSQGPLLMITRYMYENGQMVYGQCIFCTWHIIPGIKNFIRKSLPGLARILKLSP